MQKIIGKYAEAVVYTDDIEQYALAQIQMICDFEASEGSRIRIMPDVHPGKVGPVGLTMTLKDKVMPNLVGTDIGCGISYARIGKKNVEFQKLDRVIRECIPAGGKVRSEAQRNSYDFDFDDLICRNSVNEDRGRLSLGTLGSGNHFIELDRDEDGNLYLVVHSGSRHLGKEVTENYLQEGKRVLKKKGYSVPYEMTWLEGKLMESYIHDVNVVTGYAMLNREIIINEICKKMKWKPDYFGECIHNYVDDNLILRKGACAAYMGDDVIIPINSRDGIIIGTGNGNAEWNSSAPHGSGRVLNRKAVSEKFTLSEYKKSLEDVYSSTVCRETLDEAPFAYRNIESILGVIEETVDVKKILKPVYSYKAVERR